MVRRPLVPLATAVLAGTAVGLSFAPPGIPLMAALAALLAGLGLLLARHAPTAPAPIIATPALLATAAGLAVLAASLAAEPPAPSDIRHRLASPARLDVTGVVTGDPVAVQLNGAPAWRFALRVDTVRAAPDEPAQTGRGRLHVLWRDPPAVPPPAYGERWFARGPVRTGRTPLLFASGRQARFVSRGHGHPFLQFAAARRRQAEKLLAAGIEDHPGAVGLLHALLLGNRTRLPRAVREDFSTVGAFHIIAISGLHVGMVAWCLAAMLRLLHVPRTAWFPALAPLLLVYTAATGASPSAVRACVMALLYFAAPLLGRREDAPSALAAAAILILAFDPHQLHDRGFILSFSLVAGLLLLGPVLHRATPRFLRADPLQADFIQPPLARFTRQAGRAAWNTLAVSAAAWLASLPITAYFFGRVSLAALPANLIAIPLAFLMVLAGALSLATGSVCALAGELFNNANLALCAGLTRSLGALAALPGASVPVPEPPVWLIPLWFATLAAAARFHHLRYGQSGPDPLL